MENKSCQQLLFLPAGSFYFQVIDYGTGSTEGSASMAGSPPNKTGASDCLPGTRNLSQMGGMIARAASELIRNGVRGPKRSHS